MDSEVNTEKQEETGNNKPQRDEKGRLLPGNTANPDGRPVGSVSVITALKKRFRENPEQFNEFLERYIENPANERHIAEMIDGKPFARGEMKIDLPTSLIELISGTPNPNTSTNISGEDTA